MKKVAIQGIAGAFHDIAARKYFQDEEIEIVPCKDFKEVFHSLKKDNGLYGIVAIENTIAGSLLPNYNMLRESGLRIMGEVKLRIKHNLAVVPGTKIEDLKEVHSHPMAIMQCEDFFSDYKDISLVEDGDTASSAKRIAADQVLNWGCICSKLAAETYGLEVIAPDIETNKRNFTRFLIIGDAWVAEEHLKGKVIDKASVVFSLTHEEGSLAKVLSILSYYHVNLTKIQSLPIVGREWEYLFYLNLTFEDYLSYSQSLDAIRPFTRELRILGECQGV